MEEIKEPNKDRVNSEGKPGKDKIVSSQKIPVKGSEKNKGLKVFVAAKYLNLSCEAFVSILKELGYPPRGFTAHITQEEFEKVKARVKQEKSVVKESFKKKTQTATLDTPSQPKTIPGQKLSTSKIISPP
ncbi:MAG: hypothetical protein NZ601_06930, partial [candidate division WOR-3 bacterium]|nr:hypothetical protein [candidate division WOR-3 bacterium]